MKTLRMKKSAVLALAVLMVAGTNLYAQRGRNSAGQGAGMNQPQNCRMVPDLTDSQQSEIEAMRVAHLKEMNTFRNQMNELEAKKSTLMATDNVDIKEINAVIDQMSALQNKMMKEKAKHQQGVRSLLTDEQKVYFDSRPMHGNRHGKGMRHGGYGRGEGQGAGAGYGRGLNPNCPYNKVDNE